MERHGRTGGRVGFVAGLFVGASRSDLFQQAVYDLFPHAEWTPLMRLFATLLVVAGMSLILFLVGRIAGILWTWFRDSTSSETALPSIELHRAVPVEKTSPLKSIARISIVLILIGIASLYSVANSKSRPHRVVTESPSSVKLQAAPDSSLGLVMTPDVTLAVKRSMSLDKAEREIIESTIEISDANPGIVKGWNCCKVIDSSRTSFVGQYGIHSSINSIKAQIKVEVRTTSKTVIIINQSENPPRPLIEVPLDDIADGRLRSAVVATIKTAFLKATEEYNQGKR